MNFEGTETVFVVALENIMHINLWVLFHKRLIPQMIYDAHILNVNYISNFMYV